MRVTCSGNTVRIEVKGQPVAEVNGETLYILKTLQTEEFRAVTSYARKHIEPNLVVKRKPKNPTV